MRAHGASVLPDAVRMLPIHSCNRDIRGVSFSITRCPCSPAGRWPHAPPREAGAAQLCLAGRAWSKAPKMPWGMGGNRLTPYGSTSLQLDVFPDSACSRIAL